MRLEKVEYHLFPSDAAWLEDASAFSYHDIDREICLTVDGAKKRFISWVQDSDNFHLEWSDVPFFEGDGVVMDFSDHKLWADLIGKDIAFKYLDQERFIIEVSAQNAHVYLCAYEQGQPNALGIWGFDGVHISKTLPKRHGE